MAFKTATRVRVATATTGTGTVTLGAAEAGYRLFAAGGIADGDTVPYLIEDGADWEYGIGTYASAGTTMARTTIQGSTNGGAALDLSGDAIVSISPTAEALLSRDGTETVKNKSLRDATTRIRNEADVSKVALFDAASISPATERTFAFPDESGELQLNKDKTIRRIYPAPGGPGTWTKPAGLKSIVVQMQAPGGPGGPATTGPSARGGDGGGAGAFSMRKIDAPAIPGPQPYSVPTSGAFSFGSPAFLTASQGTTGASPPAAAGIISAGGAASGGDINIPGGDAIPAPSYWISTSGGGKGADSLFGQGGRGLPSIPSSSPSPGVNGVDATGYGAGGGGGVKRESPAPGTVTGGAHTEGFMIIDEYY